MGGCPRSTRPESWFIAIQTSSALVLNPLRRVGVLEEGEPQAQGPPGGGLSGEKTQAKGGVASCTAQPQTSLPASHFLYRAPPWTQVLSKVTFSPCSV